MSKPIDDMDRAIMRQLVEDARLNNTQIAERVGLSPSPCWQRIKRLERDGYIDRYTAILNREKLGAGDTVLIEIVLDRHDEETLENFGNAMVAMPEVLEVYLTTGGNDYFIKVAVNGTRGYENFLKEKLFKVPGVRQSHSVFTLKCLKRRFTVEV